jgi:hypothetical protein
MREGFVVIAWDIGNAWRISCYWSTAALQTRLHHDLCRRSCGRKVLCVFGFAPCGRTSKYWLPSDVWVTVHDEPISTQYANLTCQVHGNTWNVEVTFLLVNELCKLSFDHSGFVLALNKPLVVLKLTIRSVSLLRCYFFPCACHSQPCCWLFQCFVWKTNNDEHIVKMQLSCVLCMVVTCTYVFWRGALFVAPFLGSL